MNILTRSLITYGGFLMAMTATYGLHMLIAEQFAQEENPYKAFQNWINSFLFSEKFMTNIETMFGEHTGYYVVQYIRDVVAGTLLYYIVGGIWHFIIYKMMQKNLFPDGEMPSFDVILDQIKLAQASMLLYAGLPVFAEWLIESGFTRAYFSVKEIGGFYNFLGLMTVYLFFVEIGIYWVHRTLHTNKFLYKYVHALHHKYNKPSTLSPWASVAFNPLDGLAQASPYVVCLFFIPCHYLTHVLMTFFTAIWATNIHDAVSADSEPVMGAKYHTIHHTHYHYNFGQFFIFCDWFWGTLRGPEDLRRVKKVA